MLEQIIAQHIHEQGPISFSRFMDMALYYPEHGYYTSNKPKIGKRGDFYTAPSFSPLFGHLLAKQIVQMWDIIGDEQFTILEFGAGPGNLCLSILDYMKSIGRYEKLQYYIIEKSAYMISEAKRILPAKVQWINSIEEMPPITGCILSNELLDNLAVHRVVMKNDGLKEIFVDHDTDFNEVLIPASDELHTYLEDLQISLPMEYHAEINLHAAQWIKDVARKLRKGYVMTIDYGYPAGELAEEHRKNGTVTCYYKHRVNERPYQFIGEQDITAHVNFSALCLAGHRAGLDYSGFREQCNFLLSLGFYDCLKERAVPGKEYHDFFQEQTLTRILLYEMGRKFKVLIQRKGVADTPLTGFARA